VRAAKRFFSDGIRRPNFMGEKGQTPRTI
jgi:hypothetical protein